MDSQDMIDYINNFRLDSCRHGNQGYFRVLLQIFGFTGHGKSSFINSCKYVVDDGPYIVYAQVAGSGNKPETMIRFAYELTDTITLVDNRGCAKMSKDETGEIYAQLGNFLPLGSEVKWHSGFKDINEIVLAADLVDRSADFIVPVLVYSAQKQITPAEEGELRELVIKAKDITGLFPTVVISHELSGNLPEIQEKFRRMGVKNMFPVENYTQLDHYKIRGKHEGLLKCLYEIIRDVEFRMRERRDPLTEKIERKRVLYEFAHNREIEKVLEIKNREMEKVLEREKNERTKREELERKINKARTMPYFHTLNFDNL